MEPRKLKIGRRQLPGGEKLEVIVSELAELGQEAVEGAPNVAGPMAESVIRLEAWLWTLSQNDPGARDPVGLLAVNQVTDHIEWTEGVWTFDRAALLVGPSVDAGHE